MENLLKDFELQAKNPSEEALRRWRSAVKIVRNRRRRFRMVADLAKRSEARNKILRIQGQLEVALAVQKAAFSFIEADLHAGNEVASDLPEEVSQAGFEIDADELESMVYRKDSAVLQRFSGIEGIARCLSMSLDKGISAVERPPISIRQKIYGTNQYNENPGKSFLVFLLEALQDTTLIILMLCAVASMVLGVVIEGWPNGIYEGFGIILCIFLVVMVTATTDYEQFLQFRDLAKEKKKISVVVSRDGCKREVSIYDLVVGDVVHLYPGNQVPADGIFISGHSLLIDESCLTGESDPVKICSRNPFLLSGAKVQDGLGKMLVTSVGMRTSWGRLMESLSEWGDNETPLQVKLNGIAAIIGKIVLVFCVLMFVVLAARFLVEKALQNELLEWSYSDLLTLFNYIAISVTVFVAAVPEGLPVSVTLSLAFASRKLMNERALVRHLFACEIMGSVNCICTDKTGTLTTNQMTVDKVWICDEVIESQDALRSAVSEGILQILMQSISLNSASQVVEGKDGRTIFLGSPTDSALLEFGKLLGIDFSHHHLESQKVKVEPFNSVKKKMSVLVDLPASGLRALTKGAPEIILLMCDKIIKCNGEAVPLSEVQRKIVMNIIDTFSTEALRTLCLAFKDVTDTSEEDKIPEDGYTLLAVIGIKDPVRPGVKNAVRTCLAAGITVRMVTGDNINTATAIAKECGILTDDGLVIEGPDFRCKSQEEMKELIPKIQVLARSSPRDKHILVTKLREMSGEVVAVTGDGMNDATALRDADIGLAMGITGTEVAKENADVIIMDDNFTTIVNLVKWGRVVYLNIQKFVQFQLTVNASALTLNFLSACISGSTPFTAFQLLWISMIMDILGALALATEPPTDKLLQRPPFGRGMNFVTASMWKNIIAQSIYQVAFLLVLKFHGRRILNLQGPDAGSVLNTFIFNSFVLCQVFNEINCRDVEKLNVFHGMFNSWLFVTVIFSEVAFQVVIVEYLGFMANTVPLSWKLWLFSILIGSISMVVAVGIKCTNLVMHSETVKYHDDYDALPTGP
ncbi:hypothetical protein F0562_017448 [Nyssa sinensis]|uniref:Calcium-transporting ATPase n=1 Tax=Nyssa sinensis TaxID=561372 RepID=A0A5J4ZF45_9ASTE|nr:hypothetical protein F0562_017448 [Nyssa sinensis]